VTTRRTAPPLRVTERIDYALKSVLLLSMHDGDYLTARAVADHYGMSVKLLGGVLWCLAGAGIVDSRRGWHGGFRLAQHPESIPVQAVIAAVSADDAPLPAASQVPLIGATPAPEVGEGAASLVASFWQALDNRVQEKLAGFTVADLAAARMLQ
jgi:Rrf2 family nitric oxide-sensitive transcriptional repressor